MTNVCAHMGIVLWARAEKTFAELFAKPLDVFPEAEPSRCGRASIWLIAGEGMGERSDLR
jgi:hypothetical protein